MMNSWTGDVFALVSAISGAAASLMTKLFVEEKLFVVLLRGILQFLIIFPIAAFNKVDLLGPSWKFTFLLLARGIIGTISTITLAISLNFLPLGDTTAILYTYPVIVMLFASIFLKERCGILKFILTVITMAGFILVAQPSFLFKRSEENFSFSEASRLIGVLLAFLSSASHALVIIILRKLGDNIHFSVSILYFSIESVFFLLIYKVFTSAPLTFCYSSMPVGISAAMFQIIQQIFITLSLQRAKAGQVSLIRTSEVIFSYLFQFIFLHEIPTLLGGIGAGLILLVCIVLAVKSIKKAIAFTKKA